MSQYAASVPSDGQVRDEIQTFFAKFYEVSDSSTAHEEYATFFTKDGVLIMGPNETSGRDGLFFALPTKTIFSQHGLTREPAIIQMRHGMWEKVAKRSHKPLQIYAFGAGSDDVMLHGTVDYELKDGKSTSTIWAARANLTKEDGALRMERYQVFLVRS